MSFKEISLYIHIPFCISKCDYCDFFSIPTGCKNNCIPKEYVSALCNEIKFRLTEYQNCRIKTVYIGGGTPSLLSESQLKAIASEIQNVGLTQEYEFTVEVNPDDVTPKLLKALDSAGVNRISCGIQSFNDRALKNAHRRADSKTVYECLQMLNSNWSHTLSADLICSLPGETQESMLSGLDYLVKSQIPHISFYSLCIEEETPLGKAILSGKQDFDEDFNDELWLKGRDFLISNGYVQYEVSNFCKPGYECLHNMTYWTHKDYIACGAGGTGTIYSKGEGLRYTNNKSPDEYMLFWNQSLSEIKENAGKIPQYVEKIRQKTSEFEYFMMGLRTLRGVSVAEYKDIFSHEMPAAILQKLEENCEKSDSGFYYLKPEKLLFLNSFLEQLLEFI